MGALGVINGGGGGRVRASLFGVVKTVVVLEGAGRGVRGAAGEEGAAQQGEDGAYPAGIEGVAEGHEAFLLVSPDGEPDGGDQTAQAWGGGTGARLGTTEMKLNKICHSKLIWGGKTGIADVIF